MVYASIKVDAADYHNETSQNTTYHTTGYYGVVI